MKDVKLKVSENADAIAELSERLDALEKLLEGKLEHAVTRQEVFGAFADKVLERNRERRAPA